LKPLRGPGFLSPDPIRLPSFPILGSEPGGGKSFRQLFNFPNLLQGAHTLLRFGFEFSDYAPCGIRSRLDSLSTLFFFQNFWMLPLHIGVFFCGCRIRTWVWTVPFYPCPGPPFNLVWSQNLPCSELAVRTLVFWYIPSLFSL